MTMKTKANYDDDKEDEELITTTTIKTRANYDDDNDDEDES